MKFSTLACLVCAAAQVPFVWRGHLSNALALGFIIGVLLTDAFRPWAVRRIASRWPGPGGGE